MRTELLLRDYFGPRYPEDYKEPVREKEPRRVESSEMRNRNDLSLSVSLREEIAAVS